MGGARPAQDMLGPRRGQLREVEGGLRVQAGGQGARDRAPRLQLAQQGVSAAGAREEAGDQGEDAGEAAVRRLAAPFAALRGLCAAFPRVHRATRAWYACPW